MQINELSDYRYKFSGSHYLRFLWVVLEIACYEEGFFNR